MTRTPRRPRPCWPTRGGPGAARAEKPKDTKAGSEAEKKGDKEDEEKKGTDKAEDKDEKKTDKTEADADKKTEDADKKAEDKEEKAGDADKEEKKSDQAATGSDDSAASRAEGLYIVGQDNKPGARPVQAPAASSAVLAPSHTAAVQSLALLRQASAVSGDTSAADTAAKVTAQDKQSGGAPGAYAPMGTAAPAPASVNGPLGKDGKTLTLRFVLPSGPGSQSLRGVGERIATMLEKIGIGTEITKVPDESYFKDHIASGDYDLALYSWPATAYPATDGRPIYAKPEPATDGSLLVEQNYTRVGTDHIDQLFDQAVAELDEKAARELMKQADARIWAAAGSIPLFQRPQLVAVDKKLANVGAFGFAAPRYQDIGFTDRQAAGSPADRKK